ncbi:MAG TPA: glycosyltransferase [Stellaceae bacterium]|nr:glycosyltransferase [Stellaceae bacterium]
MSLEVLRLLDHGVLVTALALFCVVGASLPWVVIQHVRLRRKGMAKELELLGLPLPPEGQLPHVLVQLPTCNDGAVIRRVAEASANLDWPSGKLHIQILDDSTNGSADIARDAVASLCTRGIDAKLFHRATRNGYKGAALQAGLQQSDHEYVVVFDADFVPAPDFLRRCLGVLLADADLAFVQSRWDGLNAEENALTRAQQYAIDAYDAVHQAARSWSGYFVQFTGTCAVWRRAAVDDVGGWASDILPEDLDISYRALLRGWRALCLVTVAVPAELPNTRSAWQRQQRRWSNGLAQAMRKYLWPVWRSGLSFPGKMMASLCLASCVHGPLVGVIAITGAIHLLLGGGTGPAAKALAVIASLEVACAVLGIALGQRLLRDTSVWRELPRALVGIAVFLFAQVAGAWSVLDAVRNKASVWTPTPKSGSEFAADSRRLAPVASGKRPSD